MVMLITGSPRSLAEQSVMLLTLHPQFTVERSVGRYVWTGTLQPSALSDVYTMRIAYSLGQAPIVDVVAPVLQRRYGEAIPHTYADGSLCLFEPGGWTQVDWIATTTIQWSATWLAFYETWHITGEWLGGGDPPVAARSERRRRRRR